jgi:glycosyltransferase involved in cell wall biosynthesis
MAKNALLILENPEMHQKFSAAALANAEKYSMENILPHYEAYYEEVIRKSVYIRE